MEYFCFYIGRKASFLSGGIFPLYGGVINPGGNCFPRSSCRKLHIIPAPATPPCCSADIGPGQIDIRIGDSFGDSVTKIFNLYLLFAISLMYNGLSLSFKQVEEFLQVIYHTFAPITNSQCQFSLFLQFIVPKCRTKMMSPILSST